MAIISNQEATLNQDEVTPLFRGRGPVRLTLTGLSGEFTTIPFRVRSILSRRNEWFEASEVEVSGFPNLWRAGIFAKPPEGVATLDIVYETRTGADA